MSTTTEAAYQALLGQLSYLRGLASADVHYILAGAVTEVRLRPNQMLFLQDEPVERLYVLVQGRIQETRLAASGPNTARQTLTRITRAGAFLALYDFLYHQPHSTRARARSDCQLLAIDAKAMERLIYRFPELRNQLAPLELIDRLRTIPFLGNLDRTELSYLADAVTRVDYPANTTIYLPGQTATRVFLIDQGQVRLNWPDGTASLLGNGAAFGFAEPRNEQKTIPPTDHSARTVNNSSIFSIPRHVLVSIAQIQVERRGQLLRQAASETLANLPVFANFTALQRRNLAGFVSHYYIPNDHLLVQQGELSDSLWVLLPGSNAVIHALDGAGQALLSTSAMGPNYFNEVALLIQPPADSTVEAKAGSQWLRLHWLDFRLFNREHGGGLASKLVLRRDVTGLLDQHETRQRYSWLQEDEMITEFRRRHWIFLLRKTIPAQFLLLLLLVGSMVLNAVDRLAFLNSAWVGTIGIMTALQIAWALLDYSNDYILVTNRRIVRHEDVFFIRERRQEAALEQILNVDLAISLLGRLLGYGDIKIQMPGEHATIHFSYVPAADQVKRAIFAQRDIRQRHSMAENKMEIQRALEARLGLRLPLPQRVRRGGEEQASNTVQNWWQRITNYLRLNHHMRLTEEDRIIWRKHWFILIGQLLVPIIILLTIVAVLIGRQIVAPEWLEEPFRALDLVLVLAGIVDLGVIGWIMADWRNDTYEVNNFEVVDAEKQPLFFDEKRRTARLLEIDHIDLEIPSPLHRLLDFGNVELHTAAAQGVFTFSWVPDPRGVAAEIRRRIEERRRFEELAQARQRARELPDWFEMYNRLEPEQRVANR